MYRTFLIVASLVLFLTGCAAAEGDVVEFWAMGREGEVVQELMAEFEREHPGIRVRVQQIPWIAAHEKLLTAFAGDATPDICQLGNTWVPEFAALGALENLGPWVRTSAVIDSSDYFSGIWDTNVIDGQLYGIPWYVDTRLLFYRKDLLREAGFEGPPQTWDEWLTAMERIKANVGEDNYAILVPINEFEPPLILGLQTGASMLREGDRYGNFEAERFRKAFEFYVHLFENGLAPVQGTTQISNLYQEFARGYFAMYITGPWNIGEFQRRLPAEQQDDWMTAPLPGPDSLGVSTAGGASLVLFRDSEQKEAAWQLIEFLARPENQVAFYRLTGDLPPRKTAWQDSVLAENQYAEAFYEQLTRVRPAPKIPEWERILDKLKQYAETAARDQMTVDQALAALDRDVDRILEKRRWMLAQDE